MSPITFSREYNPLFCCGPGNHRRVTLSMHEDGNVQARFEGLFKDIWKEIGQLGPENISIQTNRDLNPLLRYEKLINLTDKQRRGCFVSSSIFKERMSVYYATRNDPTVEVITHIVFWYR